MKSSALFLALLLISNGAGAQFNKYRSQTRFNNPADKPATNDASAAQPEANSMSAEDAAAALKAAETIENDSAEPDVETESAFTPDTDDEANQEAFGNRPAPNTNPKNPKYVNLNPETAFGPEIVESFDFPDTDIMEITRHMQKLTGINLILDKDVKGKVSIIAPTPITVGDAWKAYLAALNMAGYSLIKTGAFYKVINSRDIRYTPTKIYTGNYTPDTENYVMRVISLKHVSAAEIARNFRPFMSRYGRIIDLKQTNTVIIADTGSNINRLAKMIKFLDIPGHEEALQIVRVKNSSAQEIAKLLDTILKGGSSTPSARPGTATPRFSSSSSGSDSTSSISRIIAEPRTNSIIAMANAEGAKQLRELIQKLDVKLVSSSSNRVHVYYLNYGDSEELSKTLSSIVSGANTSQGGGAATAGSAGGASRFSSFSSSGGGDNPIFSAEVKITSDKNNNALVVTASPTDWLTLKDVISRLDIPRDQVYVEGLILEANVTKNRAFGVEYAGAYGQGTAQRAGFLTPSSGSNGLLGLLTSGVPQSVGGLVAGFGIGPSRTVEFKNPQTGATAGSAKVNAVSALIKAIASHGSTNILATPQILAMDNTEATFEVGDTNPIVNQTIGQGTSAFNTVDQEAKLTLKITPQINKVTRFVRLKINQKIDAFKASPSGDTSRGLPKTIRAAQTEVMVRDRDTIAMGGLLREVETVSNSKVPILGDIPVLGWLFKNKSRTVEKVNLLFFMTPKILAPYAKTASVNTRELLNKRKEGMKNMFEEDETDPNAKVSADLSAKIDRQVEGPLYDLTDAEHYKNLNNQSVNQGEDEETEIDTPDYQEIRNSVQ